MQPPKVSFTLLAKIIWHIGLGTLPVAIKTRSALCAAHLTDLTSPNQVLTHAARAAAKAPFQAPLVAARGAREGLWSE